MPKVGADIAVGDIESDDGNSKEAREENSGNGRCSRNEAGAEYVLSESEGECMIALLESCGPEEYDRGIELGV
jgi:hypothetical protein